MTGANGFVGRHVVEYLIERGHDVRAATRREVAPSDERARRVPAPDLGPDSDWRAAVAGVDVVVHCAARVHIMNDEAANPLVQFRRANCEGTVALAKAAVAARVKRFVFLSSIKVNGEETPVNRPFRAEDDPKPSDPYGLSKLEAEQALFDLSSQTGMEVAVIRPVLVYGPGVRANFRAMMMVVEKRIPLPLGSIQNRRSIVFVGNLADLVHIAATHPAASGKVLLVSDGHDVSTTEILRLLGQTMRKPARLVPVPTRLMLLLFTLIGKKALAQRLFGSLSVDIASTRELLGWSPPYRIDTAFRETVEAYLSECRATR